MLRTANATDRASGKAGSWNAEISVSFFSQNVVIRTSSVWTLSMNDKNGFTSYIEKENYFLSEISFT